MTKQQLESRRSIVKKVAIALPVAGFVIPLAYISLKDKKVSGEGIFLGVAGLVLGGLLSALVIMAALPSVEEQDKIK